MFTIRKFTQVFLSIIIIVTTLVTGFGLSPAQAQGEDGIKREVNTDSGKVSFIGPENGRAVVSVNALGLADRPADPARALVERFAPEFGLANSDRDLAEFQSRRLDDGRLITRYQQRYQDIPVLAGELVVNTNDNGDLYSMTGEVSTDLSVPTQPTIDSEQARQTALRAMQKWYYETPADFVSTDPELWIYDESLLFPSTRPPELVWRMEIAPSDKSLPVKELILINTETGRVSLHFNQIDTGWNPRTAKLGVTALAGNTWYVAKGGSNSNSCATIAKPCATINGAIGKASNGDVIKVGAGTYTGTQGPGWVVYNGKTNIAISGGWNSTFTAQNGISTIDGQYDYLGVFNDITGSLSMDSFEILNGDYFSEGSGFRNLGILTLTNITILGSVDNGGIYNSGTLTVSDSSILGNQSDTYGGGLYNTGIATLTRVTFSDNLADEGGGAIVNTGNLTLTNVTLHRNVTATGNSGGLFNSGSVSMTNVTFSGNRTNEGLGGAIYNLSPGNITIRNSIFWEDSSEIYRSSGTLTIDDTIVAGGCPSGGTCTNVLNADPILLDLGDNGGSTETMALGFGSAAVDAGNNATCATTDQRGVARPFGTNCDLGAYESTIEYSGNILLSTYDAGNLQSLPGSFVCDQTDLGCAAGDADAQQAHQYAVGTYNLYKNKHNRNSIDGHGMEIVSTVHYDTGYDNAYWSGTGMVYGDGYGFAFADDIITHELTHGVTQYESNLLYYYQSGAINESFSDLWGEYYDQTNGQGSDAGYEWLLGEDVTDLGAFRSMSNPPAFGDPDRIGSSLYYKGESDNGGVHWNSGVNNKAVYLMVDGGTFNGKTVAGIGWDKTAAIYYEVQTNLLGSGSNYSDLYYALQQACSTLTGGALGIELEDCISVKNALDAVQMNMPVNLKHQVTAPLCPTGMVPSATLFEEQFEGSLSTNWTTTSRWLLNTDIAGSPTHSMYGDGLKEFLLEEANMKNGVVIQPNSYLHFEHAYDFEGYGPPYFYDGGVVEYSTNNGGTWQDAGPLFSAGANYGGTLPPSFVFGNALGGRKAFVGSSFSIYSYLYSYPTPNFVPSLVSSRYNLNSLSGQTVRFRFRYATDDITEFLGWYIDDVKIITCLGTPVVPVLQTPANNALVTDYTPTLDWKDNTTPPADRYHFQLSTDPAFGSTLYEDENLTASEFTIPTDLDENTKYYWRVRAFNELDVTNDWSAARSFRTILMAPVLTSPADLSNLLTLRPTFIWTNPNDDGPEPTNYTIQVASNTGFTTIVHTGTSATTSYTPAVNLPANKKLYWRVKANGINGPSSNSSPTISFNTPQTAPPAPTLTSPANGVLTTNTSPELKWKAGTLPGGTLVDHFQIQIDNDSDFSSPVEDENTGTTTSFIPSPDLATNTKYYWRVKTFNTLAQFSPWSAVWTFRTALQPPGLSLPVDDATVDSLRPTFDWSDAAGPGVTGYMIQISKNDMFTQIVHTGNSTISQYTPVVDLPKNSNLFWRVQTKGLNGPSAWTEVPPVTRSFATPATIPAVPALTTPANGALTADYTPNLAWTMPATSPAFDHFIVQVDNNQDFSSPEVDESNVAASPFTTSTLSSNTKFYWRVRAVNLAGDMGNWSGARNFRTIAETPVLSTPVDDAPVDSLRPTFDWSDVIFATGYTIQISKNAAFTQIVNTGNPAISEYTPAVDLPKNTNLFWRVQAKGPGGPSAWTELPPVTRSFITPNAPGIPALTAPANNVLLTNYQPMFTWTATIPAGTTLDHYQIQIDDNADFGSTVFDEDVAVSSFTPGTPLAPNAKYYWRVRTYNTDSEFSAWSAVRTVRTALQTPTLEAPYDGALLSSQYPVFNWSDVPGAAGYNIQVCKNASCSVVLVNANTTSSIYQPFNALPANVVLYWRVRSTGANGPSLWSNMFDIMTPP